MSLGPITAQTEFLADQLERSFRGGAWHGPAVIQSLEGVDATMAARHLIPGAHSIWEICLHVAAWTRVTRRRLAGEAIGGLPEHENWPTVEVPAEEAWQQARASLEEAHRELHAAVRALDDSCLDEPVAGSDPTVRGMLFGLVQHHAYHAGQIVLLRRAATAGGAA